jgi:hypothetical protein
MLAGLHARSLLRIALAGIYTPFAAWQAESCAGPAAAARRAAPPGSLLGVARLKFVHLRHFPRACPECPIGAGIQGLVIAAQAGIHGRPFSIPVVTEMTLLPRSFRAMPTGCNLAALVAYVESRESVLTFSLVAQLSAARAAPISRFSRPVRFSSIDRERLPARDARCNT